MTKAVFLHIGAFKSGTTYIQNVVWHNKDLLATQDILVPGKRTWREQAFATWDVIGASRNGYRSPRARGAWNRLVNEIAEWPGSSAVVSMELLSYANARQIHRIVNDLQPAETHVVLTARDLARTVPASWQERLKNGRSWSWSEFIAAVKDPARADEQPAKGFWRQQDLAEILARWRAEVPPERIHLVTVPPRGSAPTLLLERFGQVIGSDAEDWNTEVRHSNESLGAAEAELLRRVNPLVGEISWPVYEHAVKVTLARDTLAGRPHPRRIGLPSEHYPWATQRAREIVGRLRSAGYPVTGDLDELLPQSPRAEDASPPPDDVPVEEVLSAAQDAVAGLVVRLGGEVERLRRRAGPNRAPGPAGSRIRRLGRRARRRLQPPGR